jgi:hypothetical protein
MKALMRLATVSAAFLALLALTGGAARAIPDNFEEGDDDTITESGTADLRGLDFGMFVTQCPQAGKGLDNQPKQLENHAMDRVEQLSQQGDDRRLNQDFACLPQDETSIAINPRDGKNVVGGANDYRLGTGSSGFYTTTNNGGAWYDGIIPFPSVGGAVSPGGYLPSSGDPAIVYDRNGVVYYAMLAFLPNNDSNGVFVSRSTNGGFTWSRARVGGSNSQCTPAGPPSPCVPITNDPRQPGDGVVQFDQDNDASPNASISFNDKEYITSGPRPSGVAAQCFDANHAPTACAAGAPIGVDRLYVTWTRFNFTFFDPPGAFFQTSSQINISYSDDQGRSWSPRKIINGSEAFCTGSFAGGSECDDNQGSVPSVNPTTGGLWVGFINGDTPDEDQYLVVHSANGGATFDGPYQVTPLFDINYPRACPPGSSAGCTRPDCSVRNAQRRSTLTNSCFRVNSYANIVVDRRGGAFADDVYAIVDDNRNGTPASSNVDVFFFRSVDGGRTWIGPTRVNDDRSVAPANRDCGRVHGALPTGDVVTACGGVGNFGNDQFFPWVDISSKGDVNIVMQDRRLDTDSTKSEWPTSRQRPGNYLTWFFGAVCQITQTGDVPATGTTVPAGLRECAATQATLNRQPTAPADPGTVVPGANQTGLPFKNFQISDTPSNMDYAFPRGVFVGDYNNVAIDDGNTKAWAFWIDARNGRSSGGPGGGSTAPSEVGRNPLCEQSDVFGDSYSARTGNGKDGKSESSDDLFLVTLCPEGNKDKKSVP